LGASCGALRYPGGTWLRGVEEVITGGIFIGPDGFTQRSGYPMLVRTSRTSRDTTLAGQLWQRSELLTGVHYAVEPFVR
jgi:hypothetical protein